MAGAGALPFAAGAFGAAFGGAFGAAFGGAFGAAFGGAFGGARAGAFGAGFLAACTRCNATWASWMAA